MENYVRTMSDCHAKSRPFRQGQPKLGAGVWPADPGPTPRAMGSRLLSRLRDASGQGLVEFALVPPLIVILLVGLVQFGIAYSNYLQLTDAVRVGGRAGATQQSDSANPNTQPAACNAAKTAASQNLSAGSYSCLGTTIQGA